MLHFICHLQEQAHVPGKKKRSAHYKKERRKQYRQNKEQSLKESWHDLAVDALKHRWRERCAKSHAIHIAEIEERKKEEEKERLHISKLHEIRASKTVQRHLEVDRVESSYIEQNHKEKDSSDTSPLLLDEVVTPVLEPTCNCTDSINGTRCKLLLESARRERDSAVLLARHYRDLAEESHTERRIQKHKLEEKVELVRNFWRNKVVEGGSRSGKILRAALIRK